MNKNYSKKVHKFSSSEKNLFKAKKIAYMDESEMKYLNSQQKLGINQKLLDFISD